MKTDANSTLMSLESSSSVQEINWEQERPKIPYLSVLSDRLVFYRLPESPVCRKCRSCNSEANLKKNTPSGKLSRQTASKIRKIIDTWLSSIDEYNRTAYEEFERRKHYPIFITLTLSSPQIHTDNEIKRRMLSQFIDKLEYNYQVKHLFWRAEKQKNGNIHFHIITDKYIDKDRIREFWNSIQEKEGYLIEYKKKFGNDNPPSTHVKGFNSVKNFIDYVLKYATKEEENGKVEGRIYGMTDSLRKIRTFITNPDPEVYREVDTMIKVAKNKIITEDYVTVILFDKVRVREFKHLSFVVEYKHYLLSIYEDLYNLPFEPLSDISNECMEYDEELEEIKYYQRSFFDECPDYCPGTKEKFYDNPNW